MDDKTLQALTGLANKLGTTAEYLWDVLLKQAPLTGVIDLLMMAAWVIGAVVWCRFVARKTTKPKATEDNRYPRADLTDEAAFFSWASAVAVALVAGIVVTGGLATSVAALANPEYWALCQILK